MVVCWSEGRSPVKDVLKVCLALPLIAFAIWVAISNMGRHQTKVEEALIAQGYQNPHAWSHMLVVCMGNKDRYGFKWTATRNGQQIEGEACSGGLFQDTVIKP